MEFKALGFSIAFDDDGFSGTLPDGRDYWFNQEEGYLYICQSGNKDMAWRWKGVKDSFAASMALCKHLERERSPMTVEQIVEAREKANDISTKMSQGKAILAGLQRGLHHRHLEAVTGLKKGDRVEWQGREYEVLSYQLGHGSDGFRRACTLKCRIVRLDGELGSKTITIDGGWTKVEELEKDYGAYGMEGLQLVKGAKDD